MDFHIPRNGNARRQGRVLSLGFSLLKEGNFGSSAIHQPSSR